MKKKKRAVIVPKHDTVETLVKDDLIQKSKILLDSVIKSTAIMDMSEMSEKDMAGARIVLGFLRATNSIMKTKMGLFKMTNVSEKISALEEHSQRQIEKK